MRVLLLSHRVPHPANDGGAIVARAFIKALLAKGVTLDMLSFNTSKHYVAPEVVSNEFATCNIVQLIALDNKVTATGALQNLLLSKQSYNYSRFSLAAFRDKLTALLQSNSYDIVHLENIYLGHYIETIRKFSKAVITVRIHNIEHQIWQRKAMQESGLKAWYLNKMWQRLKQDELQVLHQCDYMFALQTGELQHLKELGIKTKGALVPFAIKIDREKIQKPSIAVVPNSVFHIASMDWMPNVDAVHWFVNDVWPKVLGRNASAVLHLAGKHMPPEITAMACSNIVIHGQVPDQYAFMQRYHTMVVPLLSGAGIRVKIVEALSHGKPIVSTKLGADGLQISHLQAVQLADDADVFAEAVCKSLERDPAFGEAEARDYIAQHFDEEVVANELYQYLAQVRDAKA
ncbi:MAG: hypothetical protein RL660_1818 [Bacteroidota bacterium]|jgi:glycosyltransferase involved in cell wall biosynthesis